MREQSKFNCRCATNFFGKISKIEKEICIKFARASSKMQSRKIDRTALLRSKFLNCLLISISIHLDSSRMLITLLIDWRTYCLSFAQLNSIDFTE